MTTTKRLARLKPPSFQYLEEAVASIAEAIRPPDRLTVPEAAEKYRRLENLGGGSVGPYENSRAPYMIEPGDVLTSDIYQGMVFCGSVQSGKTEPFGSWVTYSAVCDPADMMFIAPTMTTVRDYSKRRMEKLFATTPELDKRVLPGKHGRNVLDVRFKNGMYLTFSHPSASELRGKPIPRLWLTDYDAIPSDIDNEGSPFDLARKRTTTFGRFAMTVAESTPAGDMENPQWIKGTEHEAPPTKGILELYNRGDRRRWYWRCPHCKESFEPDFSLLRWPDVRDHVLAAESAKMYCPHCDGAINHSLKFKLNVAGKWIKDGQKWERDGSVSGEAFRSDIASFWCKGVAAGFQTWKDIVLDWLQANEAYDRTGDEGPLRTTVNTRQGNTYVSKAAASARLPDELRNRAEDWGGSAEAPLVPDGVRFLTAAVDVQKNAFVVHVYGHGASATPKQPGDIWHIDMFKVRKSTREDERGDLQLIDPAAYAEDWQQLVPEVIDKTYELNDFSGRRMQIKMVCCDSGGKEGVTTNALNFYRWLRAQPEKHHHRFLLVKGEPSKVAPRFQKRFPDAQRKDRNSGARGDVPVAHLNSNLMKDQVSSFLGRTDADGGMIHFPKWAPTWLYTQLTSEVRTPKGWEKIGTRRNEAFDLLYYAMALNLDASIKAENINWEKPPVWAEVWDLNSLVIGENEDPKPRGGRRVRSDMKKLGESLL